MRQMFSNLIGQKVVLIEAPETSEKLQVKNYIQLIVLVYSDNQPWMYMKKKKKAGNCCRLSATLNLPTNTHELGVKNLL